MNTGIAVRGNDRAPSKQAAEPLGDVGVAKALAQLQAKFLDPIEATPWPRSDKLFGKYPVPVQAMNYSAATGLMPRRAEWRNHVGLLVWRQAQEVITWAPSADAIDAYSDVLDRALTQPPHETLTRRAVGMLLDAFPNGRPPNLEAYADSMLHDLLTLRFSPTVVVMGLQAVRRASKFMPAISEVIDHCRAAQSDLENRLAHNEMMGQRIEVARLISAEPEPELPEWERRRSDDYR